MKRFVAIGECMVELSTGADDLWRIGIAGDTLNTAWYARALLTADWQVAYVTRLGMDAFSDRAARFMAQNDILEGGLSRHPTRSIGLYAISLTDGERSFAYWRDTSAARTLAKDGSALTEALAGADAVHVSGITLAILPPEDRQRLIGALAQARARGAHCVLDPNHRPRLWPDAATARTAITKAAGVCQTVLPSFDDEATLFGDATPQATAARYAALGAETVVVKNGAGRLTLLDRSRLTEIDDLHRVTPLDTTGAGDSFNAGYLAARLSGADVQAAARQGHALATRVVQHFGALMPMAMV